MVNSKLAAVEWDICQEERQSALHSTLDEQRKLWVCLNWLLYSYGYSHSNKQAGDSKLQKILVHAAILCVCLFGPHYIAC